jgi:hypothetical protein
LRSRESKQTETKTSTVSHLVGIFTDFRFLLAFGLNQVGSAFFYLLLAVHSLAIAAAGANALAFVFSAFTETFFVSRRAPDLRTSLGATLIVLGLYLCNEA